jgi:Dynactin p62 family
MTRRKYVKEKLALEPSKSTAALEEEFEKTNLEDEHTPDEQFKNLKNFYISQLMDSSTSSAPLDLSSTLGYGSPGALSRIMGLYSGVTGYGGKKAKSKSKPMREASSPQEGLKLLGRDEDVIEKMKKTQWSGSEWFYFMSLSSRADFDLNSNQYVPTCSAKAPSSVPVVSSHNS